MTFIDENGDMEPDVYNSDIHIWDVKLISSYDI